MRTAAGHFLVIHYVMVHKTITRNTGLTEIHFQPAWTQMQGRKKTLTPSTADVRADVQTTPVDQQESSFAHAPASYLTQDILTIVKMLFLNLSVQAFCLVNSSGEGKMKI